MQRTEDELRDGYAKGRHMSLEQIAAELNCSIEWVRVIETRALRKLKRWLQAREIGEDEVMRD